MDEKTSQDRHAALEAAYDKIDTETETPEPPPAPAAEPQAEPVETDGRARDDKGRFAAKAEVTPPAPDKTHKATPVQTELPVSVTPEPAAADIPAPRSWNALERELWSKIPKEARDPILRRETEITRRLSTLKDLEERGKNWERFQETIRPYEGIMRANGTTDPLQSVSNLMQTAAALQMGTPQQKAYVLARVIGQFAVDPGLVASYLEGTGQVPAQPQQFRDPRLDQLLAQMEQSRTRRVEQDTTRIHGELDKFSQSHEFFEDVREDMADLIDAWDRAGKLDESNLPAAVEKAYGFAVQLNEGVSKVVKQREAAKAAGTAQANTQKAKTAASSVKNEPGPVGAAKPKGLRDVLEAKYDELNQ